MNLQTNDQNFSDKSEDEKHLIEFTRAVNKQSDKLRKADRKEAVSDKSEDDNSPPRKHKHSSGLKPFAV